MAVHGKYSDLEKEILGEYEKEADTRQGWYRPTPDMPPSMKGDPQVTADALKKYASVLDPWNPFWSLEEYAVATRWGGLIAHPFFLERLKPAERMLRSRKGLFLTFYLMGHDYEYYQPIRPGDTIRTWALRPTLEDSTDPSGKGPRKFRYVDGQCDYINQRDETVGAFKQYVEVTLHEGSPTVDKPLDDYGYTQKELDCLAEIYEREKPLGPQIRYWEDVNVGQDMGTITDGPTTFLTMDISGPPGPPGQVPKRTFPRYEEPLGGPIMMGYVPDRETGLLYPVHGGRHGNDRAARFEGGPHAWIYNVQSRYPMCRLITNWMGDDGFVCRFGWRHVWRTPVGDALLINGKVLKKYAENGEHLVDVCTWCLNLRGTITDMALATVKLISKHDKYPDAKKVVKR
jgi:acyl dehydratase